MGLRPERGSQTGMRKRNRAVVVCSRLKSDGDGGERVSTFAGGDGYPARGSRSEFEINAEAT